MTRLLQCKVTLKGSNPPIWRRFLVDENVTFKELHRVLQTAMGWEDYHMYEFYVGDENIAPEEHGFNPAEAAFDKIFKSPGFKKMLEEHDLSKGPPILDHAKLNKMMQEYEKNKVRNKFTINTKIGLLINSEKQTFTYRYDFGDNWHHTITVERTLEKDPAKKYPLCLEGQRACPPEDCGGIYGYDELMRIRKDKNDPMYEERVVEWLGEDYDPELFVADWVNARLHGKKPVPVWVPPKDVSAEKPKKRKLRRNEPCHCNSGKKYKKCCMNKDIEKYGGPKKI